MDTIQMVLEMHTLITFLIRYLSHLIHVSECQTNSVSIPEISITSASKISVQHSFVMHKVVVLKMQSRYLLKAEAGVVSKLVSLLAETLASGIFLNFDSTACILYFEPISSYIASQL